MLRSEVGRQTGVRFTPTLTFVADAVPENAAAHRGPAARRGRAPTPRCTSRRGAGARTPARPTRTRSPATRRRRRRRGRRADDDSTTTASTDEDDVETRTRRDVTLADRSAPDRGRLGAPPIDRAHRRGAPVLLLAHVSPGRRRARLGAGGGPRARARSASTSWSRSATTRSWCRACCAPCRASTCSCAARRCRRAPRRGRPSTSAAIERLGVLQAAARGRGRPSWSSTTTRRTPASARIHLVDVDGPGHRGARARAGRPARRRARRRHRHRRLHRPASPTPARSGTPPPRRTPTRSPRGCSPPGMRARPRRPAASTTTSPSATCALLGARARPRRARARRRRRARPGVDHRHRRRPRGARPRRIDAVERVIDTLRVATEAEVAVRAQGGRRRRLAGVDAVARAASTSPPSRIALGGGGHRFAAGLHRHGRPPTEVLDASVRDALAGRPARAVS